MVFLSLTYFTLGNRLRRPPQKLSRTLIASILRTRALSTRAFLGGAFWPCPALRPISPPLTVCPLQYAVPSGSVVSDFVTAWTAGHGLLCPWDSPGRNTGVGCSPPGIFLTQGSNPGLLHCRRILYQLNHKGSPGWTS